MISRTNSETTDFVIIGAGSAGCTLYHQLAKAAGGSFRMIEAGSRLRNRSKAHLPSPPPSHYPRLFNSPVDWTYHTLPQTHLAQRKMAWPRGKGLGGSSLLNAMIYLPGSSGDWLSLSKSWNVAPDELRQHLPHQIPTALWHCAENHEIHPLSHLFVEACQRWSGKARVPHNTGNFLDDDDYAFGIFPRSSIGGRRVDAYQAFVAVQATEKRLSIETDTLVDRILFDDRRAVAIQCTIQDKNQSQQKTYFARKGIILCGGAIESPTILMRSGIGEAAHLQSLDIPVRIDLPGVGRNLQDHLLMPIIVESKVASLTHTPNLSERQSYRWYGRGPLASNIAEAGCFFDFDLERIPQLQIHFTPTHYLEYPVRSSPKAAFSLGLTLLQPRSRGRIQLASANATDQPLIDPAYLSDPSDMALMLDGLERCRQLADLEPLASIRGSELLPGEKRSTRSQLERAVRAWAQTVYHPVGTCAVGEAAVGVVDSQFRVHGTEGLYVVDASVFGRIPACNPAAQIMALASLAAYRIALAST